MKSRLIALVLVVASAACSPHSVNRDPAPPIVVPPAFVSAGEGQGPDRWWESFGDPELERLIAQAVAGNLELEAAWARLAQADAVARQAGAARWPTLDLNASASRQESRSPFAGVEGAGGFPETFRIDSYGVSLAAGYEVDVWNRLGSRARAAGLDAAAARDDVEAVAMTLASEIAEAWFDLVFQRARLELLGRQIEVSTTFFELARFRYENGLGSSLDVYQQEQQLAAVRAQVPLAKAAIELGQNRLAILVGRAPGSFQVADDAELPAPPPLPGTGLPADLLERRPDVRSARRRVVAADYRVAAAVSDRLPSLRLSGSYGYQSDDLGDLLESPVWSLASSLLAPLFDAGRRKAEVSRSEAVVDELSARYGQALLQAIVEVENALVRERRQLEHLEALAEQLELADSTLREARARYREGIDEQGFLQVLTALQSQQQAELALLQARRQLLSYRIALCRALGGSWTRALSPDDGET